MQNQESGASSGFLMLVQGPKASGLLLLFSQAINRQQVGKQTSRDCYPLRILETVAEGLTVRAIHATNPMFLIF